MNKCILYFVRGPFRTESRGRCACEQTRRHDSGSHSRSAVFGPAADGFRQVLPSLVLAFVVFSLLFRTGREPAVVQQPAELRRFDPTAYNRPMARPPDDPTVTFWGAARTVTGSMHRLDAGGQTLLLDCGLFQGRRAESRAPQPRLPVPPEGHRRRRPQPRPHRPLRQPAQPRHARASPGRSTAPRPRAPWPRSCSATPPRSRRRTPPTSTASATRGEPKVEPLYDGRDVYRTLLRLKAVPLRHAVRGRPAGSRRRSSTPATCSARRWSRLRIDAPGRRAAADVHRRPRPAGPADPARPGPGAAGRPAHQREHLRRPHPRAGRRDGRAARRGRAAHGRARRQGASSPRSASAARRRSSTSCTSSSTPAGCRTCRSSWTARWRSGRPRCSAPTRSASTRRRCGCWTTHPDLFGEQHVRYVEKVAREHRPERPAGAVRHHLGQRHVRGRPHPAPPQAQHRGPAQHGPDRRLPGRATRSAGGWSSAGRRCASWAGRARCKAEVVVLNGLSSHADHGDLLRSLGPLAGHGAAGAAGPRRAGPGGEARRTACGRSASPTWPCPTAARPSWCN